MGDRSITTGSSCGARLRRWLPGSWDVKGWSAGRFDAQAAARATPVAWGLVRQPKPFCDNDGNRGYLPHRQTWVRSSIDSNGVTAQRLP